MSDLEDALTAEPPPPKPPPARTFATDRIATFPSAALRAVPGFTFEVPDGWVVDESPDALAVVVVPQPVDGFWVNAIISTDRVHHQLDLRTAAASTLARLKNQCPDAEVKTERTAQFAGQETYLRVVQMTAPRTGRALAQTHGLVLTKLGPGAKTIDLFQIVGTCPAETFRQHGTRFVELIASFRLV